MPRTSYITITSGMSGHFAVEVWWNPEGFWEPYQTGYGRYATEEEADTEARAWADSDEIPYLFTHAQAIVVAGAQIWLNLQQWGNPIGRPQ